MVAVTKQTQVFPFELKADGEGQGIIEGHAAVFRNVDSWSEVIKPGAFTKTLQERPHIPILWQHNSREPIGLTIEASQDKKGLKVRGQLTLGVKQADEAFALMDAGVLTGLSIGFRTIKSEFDEDSRIRTLKEVELFEWSPVTFPANELARGTVKSVDEITSIINTGGLLQVAEIVEDETLSSELRAKASARIIALVEREPDQSTHDDEPHGSSGEPPNGYSLSELMKTLKAEGVL